MSQNYLLEQDINAIKGLLHYLNSQWKPADGATVAIDAKITDSNGDRLGSITITESGDYGLVLPTPLES